MWLGDITGFHSVGSSSVFASCALLGMQMAGIGLVWTLVGVIGATMVRGDRGGEVGGVVEADDDMEGHDADSGL